jgi:hypothetical protein
MTGPLTLSPEVEGQLARFRVIDGALALPQPAFVEIRESNRALGGEQRWRRAVEYQAIALRFAREGGSATGPGIMQLGVLINDLKAGAKRPTVSWSQHRS